MKVTRPIDIYKAYHSIGVFINMSDAVKMFKELKEKDNKKKRVEK